MKTVLVEPLSISDDLLEELSKGLNEGDNEFVYYDTKPSSIGEWIKRTKDCDQVILANTNMPVEVIENSSNLKYINIGFTGVDHVPVEEAKKRSILLSNARGYSDEGVSELVIGFAIGLLRNIKDADIETRSSSTNENFLGRELSCKIVGIIGTGKIGSRVGELFKAFNCRILAYDIEEKEDLIFKGFEYVSLEELLSKSDIVSLHLPLNDENISFIKEEHFKMMKKDAIFINCARGKIVDNDALARALNEGWIGGAGVDVFDYEPPIKGDYSLLNAKNIYLSPHMAFYTEEAMEKRARIVFKNAQNYIDGKEIDTLI